MTPTIGDHQPKPSTWTCDNCGATFTDRPTVQAHASDDWEDPHYLDLTAAVCAGDSEPWPCTTARQYPDPYVLAWAKGDYGFQAAAHIALGSGIRSKVLPLLEWNLYQPHAALDFDEVFAGYLSGSEQTLVLLCRNLAHGPQRDPKDGEEEQPPLDLTRLWNLDSTNRRVVMDALTMHWLNAR